MSKMICSKSMSIFLKNCVDCIILIIRGRLEQTWKTCSRELKQSRKEMILFFHRWRHSPASYTQVWFGKHQLAPSRSAMIRCHQVRFWWWLTFDADNDDNRLISIGKYLAICFDICYIIHIIYGGHIGPRDGFWSASISPPFPDWAFWGMMLSSPVGKVWRMKASKIARKC